MNWRSVVHFSQVQQVQVGLKKYASVTRCWYRKPSCSKTYMLQLWLHKNRVFFIAWCCINLVFYQNSPFRGKRDSISPYLPMTDFCIYPYSGIPQGLKGLILEKNPLKRTLAPWSHPAWVTWHLPPLISIIPPSHAEGGGSPVEWGRPGRSLTWVSMD
jgi:hypothetical protein